jgi:group I intron endonuclease
MKEKKFNFVYLTTNLVNGKQYVGDHSTYNVEKDKYLGSGKILNESIKKYGKENFKREIIEFFSTKEEAFLAQEKYIKQFNTLVPTGYNISPKGGNNVNGGISEETKIKIGNSNRGKIRSIETRKKISEKNKGKKPWLGRHHSENSKNKMSNSKKGKPT